MSISQHFSGAAERMGQTVRDYRHTAAEKARQRASQAAEVMAAARTPVDTLVSATQRLNDLTHEALGKLLSQNGATIDGLIAGGVERLQLVARAEDLRSLVREQADLYPAARERLARDLKQLWSIAARAGREVGVLASETYAELIHGVPTRTKPTARRKATRATRKAARSRKTH